MAITAKEIAEELGISAAAVSMALNGKPGVSTETRKKVIAIANEKGYEFKKGETAVPVPADMGTITLAIYRKHGAVLADTPFFFEVIAGIEAACVEARYHLNIAYLNDDGSVEKQLENLSYCSGMILLATEMKKPDFRPFEKIGVPVVVLDTYYEGIPFDCVIINNFQGAYMAADYLMKKTQAHAGYLKSAYPIGNFDERSDGFYKAVRDNGYSVSSTQVITLAPSMEGACDDMTDFLSRGEKPVRCYFADNDLIAAGALKALAEQGYDIPGKVAVIGFDDMPVCSYTNPALSTVRVPKQYMGRMAVNRLIQSITAKDRTTIKLAVNTTLVKRKSV